MTDTQTTRTGARTTTRLGDFSMVGTDHGLQPTDLAAEPREWVAAVVPGGVHETLLRAGMIEHPHFDRNEDSVRWIEDRDWWYRTTFDAPVLDEDDQLRLVFHGLDTVVQIWLNGQPLGKHENMFRPAEFDVTTLVAETNDLLLRFSPPLAGLTESPDTVDQIRRISAALGDVSQEGDGTGSGGGISPMLALSTQRRKATFSWGWDFGPRVPSIGIWRPVELVKTTRTRILSHHVRTDTIDRQARTADLTISVETRSLRADVDLRADIALTSPSGHTHRVSLPVRDGAAHGSLSIQDAELWWTHDLGDPALYDVRIELREGEQVRDVVADRVGVRTIRLDRPAAPEGGRLFRFVLNGIPIFARGAAWLPASTLVGSVSAQRHRELVQLARDGGMTMLRVWGGGIYEQDSFYTATDELGVLIWHDFMFACADYPSQDPALQREVELEAEYQVKRLRNRASMALWCGNNEVHVLHGIAYQNYEPGNWGWDFFHRLLPEAVEHYDGATPYWPGSPWGEDTTEGLTAVNGVLDGDRHAWEVWHGFDVGAGGGNDYATPGEARHFRRYARDRGRFISEFGIHASPVLSTLERWIPAEQLQVHSDSFDAHNKDHPKNKGDALLEIVTGLPTTLEQYVDFTMVSQAEGLKFGIEHYRRRQPHCNGTLVWQFNDVWPGFSWSVVDHDTVPKAGYYACKRAFSPVIATFVHEDGVLALWLSNSGAAAVSSTAIVTVADFSDAQHLHVRVAFRVEAGASARVWEQPMTGAPDQYAWVESSDGMFGTNRLFFAEIKDLPLPRAALRSQVTQTSATSASVTIEADAFTYLVRVTTPWPTARFSDNYLDLRAEEPRTITITGLPESYASGEISVGSYVGAAQRPSR